MVSNSVKLGLVFALLSVFVLNKVKVLFTVPQLQPYDEPWWGEGNPRQVDESVRPFKINVSDQILEDLRYRLEKTLPLQKPLEGVKQHYGMNSNTLQTVIDFWKNEYNWREREKLINRFPHFLTNIQGLDIHFIHVKPKVSKGVKVLPILILHGWLGSVIEMDALIPLLTAPQKGRDFVFEVVVPSLPGFLYSDGASKPGLGPFHIGVVMKNLMERLGFKKFYIQGTDWGGAIVQHMAVAFPDKVLAMHSNFCIADGLLAQIKLLIYSIYPPLFVEKEHIDIMFPLKNIWSHKMLESGYFHIQASKPDTVGVGLRESPAGLAAYMLEKISTLTDPAYKDLDDAGLTRKYSMDTLIDNIMLYWATRSITTSMRIYAEQMSSSNKHYLDSYPIVVPTGCARFKHDAIFLPKGVLKDRYKQLLQLNYYVGGHFPAIEVPEVLAEDIFMFFEKVMSLPVRNSP